MGESTPISDDARQLLLAASKSEGGVIYMVANQVRAHGRKFVQSGDHRSLARWRSAVKELNSLALIETDNGKIFEVTGKGYRVADELE